MRILLIENDFSIGRKLKNLLEKNRYTVDVATVPGDALCYGPSSPFHLIIFGVSSTVPGQTFSVHPGGTSSKPHSNSPSLSLQHGRH